MQLPRKGCEYWQKPETTAQFQRGMGTGFQALRTVWVGSAHPSLILGYRVKFPGCEISSQGGGLENIIQDFLSSKSRCFLLWFALCSFPWELLKNILLDYIWNVHLWTNLKGITEEIRKK